MRLHLVLLALTLGCATEDSKTDDTSSNGGGDGSGEENGSGDDGDGGLASLISDVAEMSATIAAQQASIAAQQASIVELELFKSSSLCYFAYQRDGDFVSSGNGWSLSEASEAYDDCF